ncbi:uncharacterized protein LOC132652941 [Meriones unguiculatus]|uniref:uncharacterized protein LOC132652941 n=1 Tax=Meriones unguiculatus TaxID=10047 RepID=UPI00293F3A6A|nr:uncharacterized protein LOC132652941 [Meriones unguiculatus]
MTLRGLERRRVSYLEEERGREGPRGLGLKPPPEVTPEGMETLREGTPPHQGRAEGTLARWHQASGEVTRKIQRCHQLAGTGAPSPGLRCRRHSGSGVPARAPGFPERPAAADPGPGRLSTAGAEAWALPVRSSALPAAPLPVAVAVANAVAASPARLCEALPLRHSSMAVAGVLDPTNRAAMACAWPAEYRAIDGTPPSVDSRSGRAAGVSQDARSLMSSIPTSPILQLFLWPT